MTPQEKKELEFVLKTGLKCAIGIAVFFFTLLILASIL
jgi:hypothetical protein